MDHDAELFATAEDFTEVCAESGKNFGVRRDYGFFVGTGTVILRSLRFLPSKLDSDRRNVGLGLWVIAGKVRFAGQNHREIGINGFAEIAFVSR
jgi:hypothetical protein